MKVICSKACPPLGGALFASYLSAGHNKSIQISWDAETVFEKEDQSFPCANGNQLCRLLAKQMDEHLFYGSNALEKTEVDSWLTFSSGALSSRYDCPKAVDCLNNHLAAVTYLVGKRITIADFAVFAALHSSKHWLGLAEKSNCPSNALRWYNFIKTAPGISPILDVLPEEAKLALNPPSRRSMSISPNRTRAQEGKFVDLPGAEMGQVVVRFPPEASGYLHIGHAKAALLNQYYQQAFNGKLIMRFDDTNPAKEDTHFEKVILEDVAMLDIQPDMFTHTSQYFDLMLEYCETMLKDGTAYVDDTSPELMKEQREQRIESANRNNPYAKNLEMWREMVKGSEKGQQCCVRAKIDMQSANGCMRDPTIYRCKNEVHPRTGDRYKVYPTYDFACPIVDSIEGVTHTLRTMEYHDRDAQFYWFIDALRLRKPYIWEYSRLSMTNTVLSKRKLTWFVQEGHVDGWDDPRMPTVRGVLRRGMTVEGLKQFIIAQGSSRSVVFMEWDKIWAFNKKVIDPIAPRYTTVDEDFVRVVVSDAKEEKVSVSKHPKNADVGMKDLWRAPNILIDRVDADLLKEGENATFINWGNLMITKINKIGDKISTLHARTNLENQDYKKTLKLSWLADTKQAPLTPTWCVYFDHIISKPLLGKDEDFKNFVGHETRREVKVNGDPEFVHLKKGDIIQIQRKGFFRVDEPYKSASEYTGVEQPIVLFYIPDGHTKETPNTKIQTSVKENAALNSCPQIGVEANVTAINTKIASQGDIVRKLKAEKAAKGDIDKAVKVLLELKSEYKNITGSEWKCSPEIKTTPISSNNTPEHLNAHIILQGNKIRRLKAAKADKAVITVEVNSLLALKAEFKQITGQDWKGNTNLPTPQSPTENAKITETEADILNQIDAQRGAVRALKANKVEKAIVDVEVKTLLDLKARYKCLTGKEWKPGTVANPRISISSPAKIDDCVLSALKIEEVSANATFDDKDISLRVNAQGDVVRNLKSAKAPKDQIDAAVKLLLDLKSEYKEKTGNDFPVERKSRKPANEKQNKEKPKAVQKVMKPVDVDVAKKQTRLGLEARKEENLSDWYSQVITKGEMIEYYDVSGCYVLRPWSFAIWETIQSFLNSEIKQLGVENCYFPIFVSRSVLEKEKTHIADFAPEVAWVTKSGDSDLAEHIAVRPTSETVMYPAFAKWIQSYRDLPIKLNQWNNVVRWEFKHPQPFLRTREFLWQEGHTAYASLTDAQEEVLTIANLYAKVYTDYLAIPVIQGRKTEKEKFAGADYTYTVEAFISASGRGIQGATSHHLGQNFSKMFDIVYEDPETQEKKFVYQNSWGLTTRTIGVMVMVHADNQGLVLPPKVAAIQVVIVPCGITVNLCEDDRLKLTETCKCLEDDLKSEGIKVKVDSRDNYSPGWKFNHWELKGVPIRIELGPKDIKLEQVIAVRRDNGEKVTIPRSTAVRDLQNLLVDIQSYLYQRACKDLDEHKVTLKNWAEFGANLDKKNIILAPFCGRIECEDLIKADSARSDVDADPGAPSMGAKTLCIPHKQPAPITLADKCIHPQCKEKPLFYTLFGRSY